MTTREVKPGALAQLRAPVVALGRREPYSYPLLMIGGVYRCGFSQVNFYSLGACPEISSKYRLRKAVRAALQGFVATVADWRQREVRS